MNSSATATDTVTDQMKNMFFTMIVIQFLNITLSLYERLKSPVQIPLWKFGGKKAAETREETASLNWCKQNLWLFHFALNELEKVSPVDPAIIHNINDAFLEEIRYVSPIRTVGTKQDAALTTYPLTTGNEQVDKNRFVYLAKEAVTLFKLGCNVDPSETMRLVKLAKNDTSEGKGSYGIETFGEIAEYYLKIMDTRTSTAFAGKTVADELQKRFDAMRRIKPLPISPITGKPMTGPELAKYLQAKLDASRSAKGGYRRKTLRRRKINRRHRRTNRR